MKKIAILILSIICFSRCVEEIPFKTQTGDDLLVVNGGFSNSEEAQEIILQKTAAYGSPPRSVLGAIIIVKNSKGESAFYNEKGDGKYVLEPKILRGVVGESYHLEIKLPNGQTYESEPEAMPGIVKPDSTFWDFGRETVIKKDGFSNSFDVVNIFVSTPLTSDGKEAFLRWRVDDAFEFETWRCCNLFKTISRCYFSKQNNPQTIQVVSSKEANAARTNKTRIAYEPIEPAYRFITRYYFSLFQHSITQKAYDYWQKTNVVANQNGSIFDRVPAYIKGNMFNKNNKEEQVLGYFEVSALSIKRLYILPYEIKRGYPIIVDIRYYCDELSAYDQQSYLGGCCNCLAKPYPNGTYEKPEFWNK